MDNAALRLFDRFAGSALGAFAGDALGMSVEGWPREKIRARHGRLEQMLPGHQPAGHYTDDTEMMIGILEALVETRGNFDPALVAEKFLKNFTPSRGYGGRIYGIMDRLAAGAPWNQVATDSFGNGSAMRTGPLGFFNYDDLETAAANGVRQAQITHLHPEALAGAAVQAGAVALAAQAGLTESPIDRLDCINTLSGLAAAWDQGFSQRMLGLAELEPGPAEKIMDQLNARFAGDVRAVEAVPPAIAAFLHTANFEAAVILAVNLGGDADTLGAMAGAVAGAYYGQTAIPPKWMSALENGPQCRDYVLGLCRSAAEIKVNLLNYAE